MLSLIVNMSHAELVAQLKDGLILMILGMGTVFVFLTVLIFATKGLSAVCKKIAPAPVAAAKKPAVSRTTTAPLSNKDNEIAAAIAVAYSKSKQN